MSLVSGLLSLLSCSGKNAWTDLSVADFELAIQDGVALVDVRTQEEYEAAHLGTSVNVDWKSDAFLEQMEATFPKETPLAIYCRSGKRSAAAAEKLSKAGYTVYNLLGGFLAWTEAGKAVSRYEAEIFFTDSGKPVTVTLIKHGSLEIRYNGRSIQVDPVSGHGKPTDYATEFPKADLILITHEHGDHLDPQALTALTGEGTRLLTNAASAAKLSDAEGLPTPEVLANGESARIVLQDPIAPRWVISILSKPCPPTIPPPVGRNSTPRGMATAMSWTWTACASTLPAIRKTFPRWRN